MRVLLALLMRFLAPLLDPDVDLPNLRKGGVRLGRIPQIYHGVLDHVLAVDARDLEHLLATEVRSAPVDVADLVASVVDAVAAFGAGEGACAAARGDVGVVLGPAGEPVDVGAEDLLVLVAPEEELAAVVGLVGPFQPHKQEGWLSLLRGLRISELEIRSRLHLVLDDHVDPLFVSYSEFGGVVYLKV